MKTLKRISNLRLLGLGCVVVLISACATTNTGSIAEADGKVQLADVHIGQSYETVMANAHARYQVEPHCEARKVALSKQRKAFLYDTCGFNPENAFYAEAPLSEVVFHFLERSLVRVDVRAQGEGDLLESVKTDMDGFFAARGVQPEVVGQNSYEWIAGNEVAGVRSGGGANTGNILVRMFDRTLNTDAPWLAQQ